MREAPAKVVASLDSLYRYFSTYFGQGGPPSIPEVVTSEIAHASHVPYSVDEVRTALGRMAHRKTTGLAVYSADLFRGV